MEGCKQVKRIIDESDRYEAIAYKASQHTARCKDCSRFADERAKLKQLLGEVGRVSAPPDFDFKLKARLAEVKARKSHGWLNPAAYLKLGAATAALVVAVVAAQTNGLFSTGKSAEPVITELAETQAPGPQRNDTTPTPRSGERLSPPQSMPAIASLPVASRNPRRQPRTAPPPAQRYVAEDGTMVLMRGPGGELEVPVPTVSVGAQSLMYVNSGRQSARSVSTSF